MLRQGPFAAAETPGRRMLVTRVTEPVSCSIPFLEGKVIFRASGKVFEWPAVLTAAYFRGAAAPLHSQVADAIAVSRYAEEEGFQTIEDYVDAAKAFRMAHGLTTGEEMERWLAHCGITPGQFEAHFAARSLLARFSSRLDEVRWGYSPTCGEVIKGMWPAALMAGNFEALVVPFARRIANVLSVKHPPDPESVTQFREAGTSRVPDELRMPAVLQDLAVAEAQYAAAERDLTPLKRCQHLLQEMPYQFTRFTFSEVFFSKLDQAREAYVCLATESLDIEEIARHAGTSVVEKTLFLEEIPESFRWRLFSAVPNTPFSPEPVDNGFVLRMLKRQLAPDLADPAVAGRVKENLTTTHFNTLVGRWVTWGFDPWTTH